MINAKGKATSVFVSQDTYGGIRTSAWTPVGQRAMARLEVSETHGMAKAAVRVSAYRYVKRALDLTISSMALLAMAPVLLLGWSLLRERGTPLVEGSQRIGWNGRPFVMYSFRRGHRLLRQVPVLVNIWKGDMSFIGPRAAEPGSRCVYCGASAGSWSAIRPGLLCDWRVRRHVSLDYVDETRLDEAYVRSCSLRKDVGIVLRALPGLITLLIWGEDPPTFPPNIRILDIAINNIPMQTAIEQIVALSDTAESHHACFVNPHYMNLAHRAPEYKDALESASLVLPDGFGLKLAGKILNRPICQNLCGTDLFPRLCALLAEQERSVFLLGGQPGVAARVVEWIQTHYPTIVTKGCHHGYFTEDEEAEVVREIAHSGADVLIVAMGVPKQDVWIYQNLSQLNVRVAMGFGGLFDYFSGRVPRAPQWLREMGMEWVYRLLLEPRRMWRRYLIGNVSFLGRVIHERTCRPR